MTLLPPPGKDPRGLCQPVPQQLAPAQSVVPSEAPVPMDMEPVVVRPAVDQGHPRGEALEPRRQAPARTRGKSKGELTPSMRQVTPAEEASFATVEHELGGRAALVQVLGGADLNADEARAVGLIADPSNDGLSLAKICALGGFSLQRLMKTFQAAALARGQVKAFSRIAEKLPDVAAGVMDDAVAGERPCAVCNALGTFPAPTKEDPEATEKCRTCQGKGTIIHAPDTDVRKMALQMGGLLDKGGGGAKVVVNNSNLNTGALGDTSSFDSFMNQLDSVLYGGARERVRRGTGTVIDAEAVDDGS